MVESNIKQIENDLEDIVKLFFSTDYKKVDIMHAYFKEGNGDINQFYLYGIKYYAIHNFAEYYANIDKTTLLKRAAKADLYNILESITGKSSPFGSLTGIRPVKFYKDSILNCNASLSETVNNNGLSVADRYFKEVLKVSPKKLDLIKKTYSIQSKMAPASKNDCGIYIGIPFCNGRCRYCSFVSADINKCGNLVEPYINALVDEIKALFNIISKNNLTIRSIYIGGGTPSSLPLESVKKILENVQALTKNFINTEYTFEAGRPDSINESLLKLLKKHNVNRISINPQSANDRTLQIMGRGHGFEDVKKAFRLAKDFNFIINADIIAGLNGEGLPDFKNTLTKVLELNPDNITVHTLCLKKGSDLKNVLLKTKLENAPNFNRVRQSEFEKAGSELWAEVERKEVSGGLSFDYSLLQKEQGLAQLNMENNIQNIDFNVGNKLGLNKQFDSRQFKNGFNIESLNKSAEYKQVKAYLKTTINNILEQTGKINNEDDNKVAKMLEFAQNKLVSKNFMPYYIYRQKYSAENLENVGYCRNESICLYNVDNMDDTVSILACGANAITKYVSENKIKRYANPKDIKTYIEKINAIITNKADLFLKQ